MLNGNTFQMLNGDTSQMLNGDTIYRRMEHSLAEYGNKTKKTSRLKHHVVQDLS